jgi:hypothetical protein
MTCTPMRRRLPLAALLAAAAIGWAAPAQADAATPRNCDERLERIEERFRKIEERRGYEAATEWWYGAWERYHERCVLG